MPEPADDVHDVSRQPSAEWPINPAFSRNPKPPALAGGVFTNEPMLVIPGEFGIRLEDHFYMTLAGPRWLTEPSMSIDSPFG